MKRILIKMHMNNQLKKLTAMGSYFPHFLTNGRKQIQSVAAKLALILLMLTGTVKAQQFNSGIWEWVKQIDGGTSASIVVHRVAVDKDGYVYLGGRFSGTVNFGASSLSSIVAAPGPKDIFLSKYDSLGNNIWNTAIKGSGEDKLNDICFDHLGGVYITGYVNGTATIGAFNPTAIGGNDIFVAKLNSSGTFLWANRLGNSGSSSLDEGLGIAADIYGNVYTSVTYFNSMGFSNNTLSVSSGYGYALLSFNASTGARGWNKNLFSKTVSDVCTDNYGSVYFGASDTLKTTFYKYNCLGYELKQRTFANITGMARLMNRNGKIYAFGTSRPTGTETIDGHSVVNSYSYVAAFDTAMTNIYLKKGYVGLNDYHGEIAVDDEGTLTALYNNWNSDGIPNGMYIGEPGNSNFPVLIQYDANGDAFNMEHILFANAGSVYHNHYGLALSRTGHYYTGGSVSGLGQVGTKLLSNGSTDVDGLFCKIKIPNKWQQDFVQTDKAVSFGAGTSNDSVNVSTVDPFGNIIMAGINNITKGSVVKYDANGNLLWQKNNLCGSTGGSSFIPSGVETDPVSGSVYVCGKYFGGSFTIDTVTVPSAGSAATSQSFLFKLDPATGTCIWARTFGLTTNSDMANDLHVDKTLDHFIHVTGDYRGAGFFGSTTLPAATGLVYNTYWVKMDTSGNYVSVVNVLPNSNDFKSCASVDGDATGNVFFTGYYSMTTSIGAFSLPNGGQNDMFLAKFNNTGTPLWATHGSGLSMDVGTQVKVDASGNACVVGYSDEYNCNFQNGVILNNPVVGQTSSFVVKYNGAGVAQWAKSVKCFIQDEFKDLCFNSSGDVYVTGYFKQILAPTSTSVLYSNEDVTTKNAFAGAQLLLMKYKSNGQYEWSQTLRSGMNIKGRNIHYNSANGNLYCTGIFDEDANLQGNTLIRSAGTQSYDWFMTRFKDLNTCSFSTTINSSAPACNMSNGSLNAVTSGGTAPYRFSWSTGDNTSSVSNIGAGTYHVKVTDTTGCVAYDTLQVGMTLAVHQTSQSTCYGQSNASAAVSVTGGSAPFTYSWSNGATTASTNSLSAGTQTVSVTTAGCTVTQTVTITQPAQIQNYICHTQDSIWVAFPQNGYSPYTYSWSNSSIASGISNTSYSTNYSVTTTDMNGCVSAPSSKSIPAPAWWKWTKVENNANSSSNFPLMNAPTISDKFGNLYVGSTFTGTVTVGPNTYTSTGAANDFFVAKYDPQGNFLWSNKYGSTGPENLYDIGVDTAGNVFITGEFGVASFTIGTFTLTPNGNEMFIVKLNAAGTVQWAKQSSGTGGEHGTKLCVDLTGNAYVLGYFTGTGGFGAFTYPAIAGQLSMFTARFNSSNGTCAWAKRGNAPLSVVPMDVVYDRFNDKIVMVTQFEGTGVFGSYNLVSVNQDNAIVRYNAATGVETGATRFGTDGDEGLVSDFLVAPNGDYFLYYSYTLDTVVVGTDIISPTGVSNIAISRFTSSGTHLKTYHSLVTNEINSDNSIYPANLVMNSSGELFAGGTYAGKARLNAENSYLISDDYNPIDNLEDVFLIKFDQTNLTLDWATTAGGDQIDYGCALALDTANDVLYYSGFIKSVGAYYEPLTVSSSSTQRYDLFAGRLSTVPMLQASVASSTAPSCNNGTNGSATVTSSGGQAPFTYSWSPGGYTTATVNTLSPGSYTVTVTDAQLSVSTVTISLSNPAPISVSSGSNLNLCNGATGSFNPSGGVSYSWSPSTGLSCTACQSPVVTASAQTTYTVTVTDGSGCSNTASATVFVSTLNVNAGADTTLCNGSSITLSGTGSGGVISPTAMNFTWAQGFGGTVGETVYEQATDAAGNTYITGSFTGTITIGTFTITSAGNTDVFVAKYNSSGACQWAVRGGSTTADNGYGITTDGSGNVYVCGSFGLSITFGSLSVTSTGSTDCFVAKFNSSGVEQWLKKGGGASGNDVANSITADASGNCFVGGSFQYVASFGSFSLTSAGSDDIFIVKYNTSGTEQWAQKAGGTTTDKGYGICVDNSGNVGITGYIQGTVVIGSTTLTTSGSADGDVIVAKLSPSGSFLWAVSDGGTGVDAGYGISSDATGNFHVSGYTSGSSTFGTITFTGYGSVDGFIAKYNSAGILDWAKNGGSGGADNLYSIVTDAAGNNYVCGTISSGTSTFGSLTTTSYGNSDAILVMYDASGNEKWLKHMGGSSNDQAYGIGIDASGNIYMSGTFSSTASFDALSLVSAGGNDVFIGKLLNTGASTAVYSWAPSTGLSSTSIANPIASPTVPTTYTLTLTDGTCTVTDDVVVNVTGCVGIREIDPTTQMVLWPNPNDGTFWIKADRSSEGGNYCIINSLGQIVSNGVLNSTEQKMELGADLASGIYILCIRNKERDVIQQIRFSLTR